MYFVGDNKYSVNYILIKLRLFPQCRRIEKPKTQAVLIFCSNNKIDMLTNET